MLKELPIILIKGLIGGSFVMMFSAIGELLKPRGFAGIFAGAPSVALGSLIVTLIATGPTSAQNQSLGMIAGAVALFIWCLAGTQAIKHFGSLKGSLVSMSLWLIVAFGLWAVTLQ